MGARNPDPQPPNPDPQPPNPDPQPNPWPVPNPDPQPQPDPRPWTGPAASESDGDHARPALDAAERSEVAAVAPDEGVEVVVLGHPGPAASVARPPR